MTMITCRQCQYWWHDEDYLDAQGNLLDDAVWGTCQLHSHIAHESREGVADLPRSNAEAYGDSYQTVPSFTTYKDFGCNAGKVRVAEQPQMLATPLWHAMQGFMKNSLNIRHEVMGHWQKKASTMQGRPPCKRWQLITCAGELMHFAWSYECYGTDLVPDDVVYGATITQVKGLKLAHHVMKANQYADGSLRIMAPMPQKWLGVTPRVSRFVPASATHHLMPKVIDWQAQREADAEEEGWKQGEDQTVITSLSQLDQFIPSKDA